MLLRHTIHEKPSKTLSSCLNEGSLTQKEYLLHESIYMKFKGWSNSSMWTEIRTVAGGVSGRMQWQRRLIVKRHHVILLGWWKCSKSWLRCELHRYIFVKIHQTVFKICTFYSIKWHIYFKNYLGRNLLSWNLWKGTF